MGLTESEQPARSRIDAPESTIRLPKSRTSPPHRVNRQYCGEVNDKLGFNATWSMAVGGMVGGGIFSTLGVVIGIAGPWAWLSFVTAGLIALAAGYSYVRL